MELNRPPGPRGWERVRTILNYRKDPFAFYENALHRYGPIVHNGSFGFDFYIISEPHDIEHVLVHNARNYQKDYFLRSWKRVFGQGLLTSEGETWKRERRMVQPSFHRDRMQLYGELMIRRTIETTQEWIDDGNSDTSIRVLNQEMRRLTLDIVVRALFGTELPPRTFEIVRQAMEVCSRYFGISGTPIGSHLVKLPLPIKRRYQKSATELEAIIDEILEKKRTTPGDDLISTLISARDGDGSALSHEQIRDELMTLFLAGHDTTALALCFTLYLLGRHPDVQEKARAEVHSITGVEALSARHLERLSYTRKAVQESLRLFPPAWVLAREAIGPDQLSGYSVPAGAEILIPVRAIHRKPQVFPDPERFQPERWTEEFTRALPRSAYLPFGFGPRMCIGSHFAMMEATLVLAAILDKYSIKTLSPERLHCDPSITSTPREDIRVQLTHGTT